MSNIVDGVNPANIATVKAASTAIVATDTPLVVGLHPSTTARIAGNAGALIDGATGAAVPANALLNGLRAATANPANATGGNTVACMADKAGRAVVTTGQVRELVGVQNTTVSVTTANQPIIAAVAAEFHDLSSLIIENGAVTANTVTIIDNATTRFTVVLGAAVGATQQFNFPIPLPQLAASTTWNVTQSAATAVNYTAIFLKNS